MKITSVGMKNGIIGVLVTAGVLSTACGGVLSTACSNDSKEKPAAIPGPVPLIQPQLSAPNLLQGASIITESLTVDESPDAQHLLEDNTRCWTPQDPARNPAEGHPDACNSVVEIQLAERSAFNTAIIEEVGNEVQYFRLQALVDNTWQTLYQSEKIQSLRLCSFKPVTSDRIRLSIDRFRDSKTPAQIKSLRLYNEPKRTAASFQTAVYQRLDGDVPSTVLARGTEAARAYARFYDVYNTVIVFGAIKWDAQGNVVFSDGEAWFAREFAALKELIALRSHPERKVKVLVTVLADGADANNLMRQYRDKVAGQIIALVEQYDMDGVDIDWEYPWNAEDWHNFDLFFAQIDDAMQQIKPGAILSAALSAWALGMQKETMDRIDQVQFMAYDGRDEDGYQSSLQQAQASLADFVRNGVDIGKINIGIAAYGRPVNGAPYWATWRDLQNANYWDSKYYHVLNSGQIYDGTFCAPALAGDKTAYSLFCNAGGIMVFRLACDKTMDDPNSVTWGIENVLQRYITR